MNLDALSNKQLNELERMANELRVMLKRAKLQDETLTKSLYALEDEARKTRCQRFDEANPQFRGY
jgi:hypothetical protein